MSDPLAASPEEFRAMARAAMERAAQYYESLSRRPVFEPTTSPALRNILSEPLPREGCDFESLLDTVESVMIRYSRHSAHPRLFGYICSPGTAVSAAGSILGSALNANVTAWRSSPAATEVEHVTINWLKEMLGYPAGAAGLFTSGGSMANLAGLAAARTAKAPVNVVR